MAKKKTTKKRTTAKKTTARSGRSSAKRKATSKKTTAKKTATKKTATKKKATPKKKSAARKSRRTRTKKPTSLSLDGARTSVSSEWRSLFPCREHAIAVFEAHRDELLSRPDVTGAHVGLRRDGKDQEVAYPLEYVIRVHVARKWDKNHPMIREMLPPSFSLPGGGPEVKTDVMESSYQTIASPDDRFLEPVRGGIPIANESLGSSHWGTFGIRMFHGDEPVLLTNRHVIGPGKVIQPPTGKTEGGAKAVVGSYVNGIHDSEVDCAIISDTTPRQVGSGVADAAGSRLPGVYVARRLTVADEKRRTEVFKIGARTGRTKAVVKNTSASVKVNGFVMHGQIIAQSTDGSRVIQVGDSGSALISEVKQDGMITNAVVGLVHAESGDGTMIIACHFDRVQERLGISLS